MVQRADEMVQQYGGMVQTVESVVQQASEMVQRCGVDGTTVE
jgi:hypothetical protein